VKPRQALICLAEFSLSAPQADPIVIYDCVASISARIGATKLARSAEVMAEAHRVLDARQMEFQEITAEATNRDGRDGHGE
jgi:hypothetical protein